MIRPSRFNATVTAQRQVVTGASRIAQGLTSAETLSKAKPLVQSFGSLAGTLLFVAFGVSLASGLVGSVALESARRENVGFSSRAAAADVAAETLKLEVERLRQPREIEGWAKLNGFTRDDLALTKPGLANVAAKVGARPSLTVIVNSRAEQEHTQRDRT